MAFYYAPRDFKKIHNKGVMCNDPEVTKILGYIHAHPKTDRDHITVVLGLKKVPIGTCGNKNGWSGDGGVA